jgi:hypothetical protein
MDNGLSIRFSFREKKGGRRKKGRKQIIQLETS